MFNKKIKVLLSYFNDAPAEIETIYLTQFEIDNILKENNHFTNDVVAVGRHKCIGIGFNKEIKINDVNNLMGMFIYKRR